jgi:hypothetical protein
MLERVMLDASDQNNEKLSEPYPQPTVKGFILGRFNFRRLSGEASGTHILSFVISSPD